MRHRTLTCSWVLAVVVLTAAALTGADEAPKEPAAAEAADAKAAADPGEEAVGAARAFFRAFVKGDDPAAYAMTTPTYRQANPAETFAQRMAAMRDSTNLKEMPPVRGWVLLAPKEGEPRRALLATSGMRISRRAPGPVLRDGRPANPNAVGLELIEKDGRWLVADVRELPMARAGGEADEFAAPIRVPAERARRRGGDKNMARAVASAVEGVLTEVKAGSVTIKLKPAEGDGAGESAGDDAAPAPQRTFKVDEKTSVTVGTTKEMEGRNGRRGKVVRYRYTSAADLKAGNEATIEPGDEDDYAADVRMMMPPDAGGPGL